jgi:transcription antitermination factor NusG
MADFEGLWWVAHTKSRNEKALAQDLISRNISYFLPMTWQVRRKSGRTLRSLLPLFGGYLFFCGTEDERVELLRTNRVANLISVEDQEKLVRELSQIENALRAGAPLIPHKYIEAGQHCRVIAGPLMGQHCRVIAGPLMGLEGIVVRTKGTMRLVLQVDILGKATSAEIDIDMIETVQKDP